MTRARVYNTWKFFRVFKFGNLGIFIIITLVGLSPYDQIASTNINFVATFEIFHLVQLVDANVSIKTLFSKTCRASRRQGILASWLPGIEASGHQGI